MRARLLVLGLLSLPLFVPAAAHAYCDPIGYDRGSCAAQEYGRFCRAEPRRHVPGMRWTPRAGCLRAMDRLAHHRRLTPSRACGNVTRRRPRSMRRSPYRVCVNGGVALRRRR